LRSKLTVWKEEQFTVLPFQGIEQWKKRVAEWISKVLMVMAQVVRDSSISVITSARIIGAHVSTIKTLFSSSSAVSTEWRRMLQDSRSKSGRRTLTHHGDL
jgi:hypothetical protein